MADEKPLADWSGPNDPAFTDDLVQQVMRRVFRFDASGVPGDQLVRGGAMWEQQQYVGPWLHALPWYRPVGMRGVRWGNQWLGYREHYVIWLADQLIFEVNADVLFSAIAGLDRRMGGKLRAELNARPFVIDYLAQRSDAANALAQQPDVLGFIDRSEWSDPWANEPIIRALLGLPMYQEPSFINIGIRRH